MCGNVSASNAQATGSEPIRTARPRSVAIMMCRFRARWSAQAPACSEKRRFGASSAATRYPICAALASSVRTATSGRAITLTWSPSSETDWPSQKRRKLRVLAQEGRHEHGGGL